MSGTAFPLPRGGGGSLDSGGRLEPRPVLHVPDVQGKHRIRAELKRLNQEICYLEEELKELENTQMASSACQEFLDRVQATPDPLLPLSRGPENPAWDRWFERITVSHKCWIC